MSKPLTANQRSALLRKTVEIKTAEVDFRTKIDGKTFDEINQIITDIRQEWLEYEVLYGCNVTVSTRNWGSWRISARRPETDNEYNKRQEKNQLAAIRREANKEKEKAKTLNLRIQRFARLEKEYLRMKAEIGESV